MRLMTDLDLAGRRVMIREDLNVPLDGGRIVSTARLDAALPTLRLALGQGAKVIVLSHLGRPAEGRLDPALSLAPVARALSAAVGFEVPLAVNWLDGVEVAAGRLVLGENVRFNAGEKANDETLARRIAAQCDIFVMDAFGAAHRAHASTEGAIRCAPLACAGPLLAAEVEALDRALAAPRRPLVAVIGGAKVSSKLGVLRALLAKVDHLITGGGIANTLLAAAGKPVGDSLHEPEMLAMARELLASGKIPLPVDVAVAERIAAEAEVRCAAVDEIRSGEKIVDIGPRTIAAYTTLIAGAGTILWNGPLGIFEIPAFAAGTKALAEAVAAAAAYSIAGGGDTLAALEKWHLSGRLSHLSTGGGAFLEYVEGRTLPALAALRAAAGE